MSPHDLWIIVLFWIIKYILSIYYNAPPQHDTYLYVHGCDPESMLMSVSIESRWARKVSLFKDFVKISAG